MVLTQRLNNYTIETSCSRSITKNYFVQKDKKKLTERLTTVTIETS
jgi:hypothetical protein